jgi:mannose-6-phosphate isomerase
MKEYHVKTGDSFILYAGTMHYSQGGVLFYEIMQNSDVYIGLGRIGDDLSSEQQKQKIDFIQNAVHLEDGFIPKINPISTQIGHNKQTFVLACQYFALERLDLSAEYVVECDGERFYILSQIDGYAVIKWEQMEVLLKPGQSCMLPASIGDVRILPESQCAILKAYVPDLQQNIINPCRALGFSDSQIAGLGGFTRLNPMITLLDHIL